MAPGSYRDYLEEIRRAADLAAIVGETVKLRRAGNALVGLCPFHQEKTPSFRVSPEKGVFHCFGCQVGGDVFTYMAELHGISFTEAADLLGERYGIPRPRVTGREEDHSGRRRKRILKALELAQHFFAERLAAPEGARAREYLGRRGYGAEAIAHHGLGWAPTEWDRLLRHLAGQGFSGDEISEAGLALPRRSGGGFYDRFRGRLTFPIRDTAGRVVSFGGRALGDDEPKYLNGPESPVYDKSRTLFRLSEVAQEVRRSGQIVIVEGYFDALGLSAAGIPGVVAVCGTALGPHHADVIRRWAEKVVLFFDGDTAGRKATMRALGPLLGAGLGVRVVAAPAGKDPDEMVRAEGVERVREMIDEAADLPTFLVLEARRSFDLEAIDGRVAAVEMMLEHLVLLPSALARAEAASQVAAGLGIEDQLMLAELQRAARARRKEFRTPRGSREAAPVRIAPAEAVVLRFLDGLVDEDERRELLTRVQDLPPQALGSVARAAVTRWSEGLARREHWDLRRLAETAAEGERQAILALAFEATAEPDREDLEAALVSLQGAALRARLKEVQQKIGAEADAHRLEALMAEKVSLAREIQGLKPVGDRGAVS
ncbi:MAG: DNA primase [Acidobacteriota bacterium]|nr:DNA primase [Acidobacteriota bacterium]MDQ7087802.1 DNA primase [Acidobacteriota bacterium]